MIIKVFGSKLEGKTTIANLILKALEKEGLSARVNFEDEVLENEALKVNLDAMRASDDFKCEVRTINLKDERRPQYALNFEKNNE